MTKGTAVACRFRSPLFVLLLLLLTAGSTVLPAGDAVPADVPADWWAGVRQQIADAEYEVSWQNRPVVAGLGAAWHAPNRAQSLRTYFVEDGIRVVSRTEQTPSWVWGLSVVGYGRGTTAWPLEEARLSPLRNRVDYDRGALDEWYVNDPRGLAQGFVLQVAPEEAALSSNLPAFAGSVAPPGGVFGVDGSRLVHLDLALHGDLNPIVAADGQAVDFAIPGGAHAVRHGRLVAKAAGGQDLPAWIEGVADGVVRGVRLLVDDTGGEYPITVELLVSSPAWTAESNQVFAAFAWSVATAGDVDGDGYADVIVGAPEYDGGETFGGGRAFVYRGSPSGLAAAPSWRAEGDRTGAKFGRSVATAGDVNGDGYSDVIVGAPWYNNKGRAFVFLGSASGLRHSPAWTKTTSSFAALYGSAVGTTGDVNGDGYSDIVVGAPSYAGNDAGATFVYAGSPSGPSTSAAWVTVGDRTRGYFGASVGTAGDVNGDGYADLVVGAAGDWFVGVAAQALVYLGSDTGLSTTPSWTVETDPGPSWMQVGTAGDVNGDGYADVIVGDPTNRRVLAFLGSSSGPSPSPAWTVESDPDQYNDHLGSSVGTAGDVNGDGYADVVVGAYSYDAPQGEGNEGKVFVYLGSASGLSPSPTWTEEGEAGRFLGRVVGTAGDVNGDGYAEVIVASSERVSVFPGSASAPSLAPSWMVDGPQHGAWFGFAVTTAGDVNGDGYSDVVVGAPGFSSGQVNEGRAFLYLGSAFGLSLSPAWTKSPNQVNAYFGYDVGTAGDVNGDGYADVVVGALGNAGFGLLRKGFAQVYLGSASGLSPSPSWTAEGEDAAHFFGSSVGTAGDVNGDGYADVIVGAPGYPGTTHVYLGSPSGPSSSPSWQASHSGDLFGHSVGAAGDVNGDGYSDVIVGATYAGAHSGSAFVFCASPSGLRQCWMASGLNVGALFGGSVGTAGDVNGDGYADVVIGSPTEFGGPSAGQAAVYLGSDTGLSSAPSWTMESNPAPSYTMSVATAGDVNGDGYADLIVGDPGHEESAGRVLVFLGSPSGPSASPSWTVYGDALGGQVGGAVGSAGDVNGDGYADVIQAMDPFTHDRGRVVLFYGNDSAGASVVPQQRRADDSTPVGDGGRSWSVGSFRLSALGRSPFGRAAVKQEWEVKRIGALFDGTGTQRSAVWYDTGTEGVSLDGLISGLPPNAYHWRVRFMYDAATSPFLQVSRWFTVPLNGWNETDIVARGSMRTEDD